MNSAIKAYYEIQWLSLKRLWTSFPLLFKIGTITVFICLAFVLYKTDVSFNNWKLVSIFVILYLVIGNSFKSEKSEKILFHNYNIPFFSVYGVRMCLLALPFYLIQWEIGVLCSLIGCLSIAFKPDKISTKEYYFRFKPKYFFRKSAYQWHAFYRQGGFLVHCITIIGVIMGIIHENQNLSIVSCSLMGVIPGIFSQSQMEPLFFLKSYNNPAELMKQKTLEQIYNISGMQLPFCILLSFFGIRFQQVFLVFLFTIILSWINMAIKYSQYPNSLAHAILSVIIIPTTLFCLISGSWLTCAVVIIIFASIHFMKKKLVRIFYQKTE